MDYAYKIIIAGDGGVGKTTLLRRIATDQFEPQSMTLGLNHEEWIIREKSDVIHLVCWDLGGQEQFQLIHHMYSRGTAAYLFAYDCTRPQTLWNLPLWMENLKQGQPKMDEIPKFLIGMKGDLGALIDNSAIQNFLDEYHIMGHYVTSSKTGNNVRELFDNIGKLIHKHYAGRSLE